MSIISGIGLPEIGYWICATAFIFAAVLTVFSELRELHRWLMVGACATSSLWAAAIALRLSFSAGAAVSSGAEIVRDVAWIALLISMQRFRNLAWPWPLRRKLGLVVLAVGAGAIVAFASLVTNPDHLILGEGRKAASIYPQLLLSIFALVLIENLYRNCHIDGKWGIKTLCIGLSLAFFFDFVFYADALFAGKIDPSFLEARGFVHALAVPLLALSIFRSRNWGHELRISRDVVFHSAVLLGSGIYLLVMAALGVVLHLIGGWPALQMTFLIATVLAMLVILSSKSVRSTIHVYISKNFFSHKYDYREVWLKFISDLSTRSSHGDLQHRILHAVADIFDCPAGALWILQPNEKSFAPLARWNFGDEIPSEATDAPFVDFLRTTRWIVDVSEYRRHPAAYRGLMLPSWLETHPRAWLLAPLIHNGKLQAFLVLGAPRAPVEITWEELDLLRTIGEQAASYLAEEQASRALIDATRIEEFSRWSAFLVHDIKGIVGQMSLLLGNAEQHAHNHEFQRDVVATVASAVLRMRKLLDQLNAGPAHDQALTMRIDVATILQRVEDRWRRSIPALSVSYIDRTIVVDAREDALISVLDHLIQNAFEASAPDGQIKVALRRQGNEGMLEVQDDGCGMDPTFVRDQLFKPLSSSKPNGLGIGAFQVRQLVQGMGGNLEVITSPGGGTTMRVRLPLLEAGNAVVKMDRKIV